MNTPSLPAHLLPVLRYVVVYDNNGECRRPAATRREAIHIWKALDEDGFDADILKV